MTLTYDTSDIKYIQNMEESSKYQQNTSKSLAKQVNLEVNILNNITRTI